MWFGTVGSRDVAVERAGTNFQRVPNRVPRTFSARDVAMGRGLETLATIIRIFD